MTTQPAGLREGIKETGELVLAIAKTLALVKLKRADDGKISRLEALSFVQLLPDYFSAVVGVGNVFDELKDLSAEELDYLLGLVLDAGLIPDDAEKQDKLDIVLKVLWTLIDALRQWQNIDKAPVAEPQKEDAE